MKRKPIDREIRPLIQRLNAEGFTTAFSCSGHHKEAGYVIFKRRYSIKHKPKVRNILAMSGWQWSNFVSLRPCGQGEVKIVPVGKTFRYVLFRRSRDAVDT